MPCGITAETSYLWVEATSATQQSSYIRYIFVTKLQPCERTMCAVDFRCGNPTNSQHKVNHVDELWTQWFVQRANRIQLHSVSRFRDKCARRCRGRRGSSADSRSRSGA